MGKYSSSKSSKYEKGANRPGGTPGATGGLGAIRRAYRGAVADELAKLESGPVRQFTPEEIAKLNAELRGKK